MPRGGRPTVGRCNALHSTNAWQYDSHEPISPPPTVRSWCCVTTRFHVTGWRSQLEASTSSQVKRVIYRLTRPALELGPRRALSRAYLARLGPCHTLFDRGLPLASRRRRAIRGLDVRASTVLIQGTGSGWDVVSWAELRPKRIIAVDLTEFAESWEQVARHCRDRLGVGVEFRSAPLESLAFIDTGAVDLCASDAVLEHCTDLASVLEESVRLLRRGGKMYASYGPLWWGPGGDHYSGRGGLSEIYNHVLLEPDAYRSYFERHLLPTEDFQSGGRYVELDLFSKLSTFEYLDLFERFGFQRDETWIFVSRSGQRFRRTYPGRWAELRARLPQGRGEDDLVVWANTVYLTKAG